MQKVDVEYLEYMWPMRHFLITCGTMEGDANIIAVSFCMPVSKTPPMLACAVGHEMHSCGIMEQRREFVVNVPPQDLKQHIYYCGTHSGKQVNKFQETGLTPQPARQVNVPVIKECVAHMECRVEQVANTGDKRLFVGTVLEAYADEDLVQGLRKVEFAGGGFPRKIYGARFTDGNKNGFLLNHIENLIITILWRIQNVLSKQADNINHLALLDIFNQCI